MILRNIEKGQQRLRKGLPKFYNLFIINFILCTEDDSGNGDNDNENVGNGDATAPPDTSNSNGNSNSKGEKAVKTGDDTSVLPSAVALAFSLTAAGVILYRKKREQS